MPGRDRLSQAPGPGIWELLFSLREGDEAHHTTHGLHPHWLLADDSKAAEPRRHLFFYAGSADTERRARLRSSLLSYRVVFGQPNQEVLLEEMHHKMMQGDFEENSRNVRSCWINLAPFDRAYLRALSLKRAKELIHQPRKVHTILAAVESMLKGRSELQSAAKEIERLVALVRDRLGEDRGTTDVDIEVLAGLWYLSNPFDQVFDGHPEVGLLDDLEVIRSVRAVT